MLGVILPHGILFRGSAEAKIRTGMLNDDLIETVIGLSPNLFYGTGVHGALDGFRHGPARSFNSVSI